MAFDAFARGRSNDAAANDLVTERSTSPIRRFEGEHDPGFGVRTEASSSPVFSPDCNLEIANSRFSQPFKLSLNRAPTDHRHCCR